VRVVGLAEAVRARDVLLALYDASERVLRLDREVFKERGEDAWIELIGRLFESFNGKRVEFCKGGAQAKFYVVGRYPRLYLPGVGLVYMDLGAFFYFTLTRLTGVAMSGYGRHIYLGNLCEEAYLDESVPIALKDAGAGELVDGIWVVFQTGDSGFEIVVTRDKDADVTDAILYFRDSSLLLHLPDDEVLLSVLSKVASSGTLDSESERFFRRLAGSVFATLGLLSGKVDEAYKETLSEFYSVAGGR